jgi:hypothetical protein
MPQRVRRRFVALREHGPFQSGWPNYGRLRQDLYHCHLAYDWVACWHHEKGTFEIEVYYVGSRQDTPY